MTTNLRPEDSIASSDLVFWHNGAVITSEVFLAGSGAGAVSGGRGISFSTGFIAWVLQVPGESEPARKYFCNQGIVLKILVELREILFQPGSVGAVVSVLRIVERERTTRVEVDQGRCRAWGALWNRTQLFTDDGMADPYGVCHVEAVQDSHNIFSKCLAR